MSKSEFMSQLSETKEIVRIEQKAFVILLIKCRTCFWDTRYRIPHNETLTKTGTHSIRFSGR